MHNPLELAKRTTAVALVSVAAAEAIPAIADGVSRDYAEKCETAYVFGQNKGVPGNFNLNVLNGHTLRYEEGLTDMHQAFQGDPEFGNCDDAQVGRSTRLTVWQGNRRIVGGREQGRLIVEDVDAEGVERSGNVHVGRRLRIGSRITAWFVTTARSPFAGEPAVNTEVVKFKIVPKTKQ